MSSNEGLEAEEILDVEVPTAAKVTDVGGMPGEGAAIQNFVQITEGENLVKERKHEEALKEAVQQARQRERRRILNKVKSEIEKKPNHAITHTTVNAVLEEFEEEVSEE